MKKLIDLQGLTTFLGEIRRIFATKTELTGYQPKGEYVTVSAANDAFVKKADMAKAMNYRGSVDKFSALPKTGVQIGDMYNVSAADPGHGIKAGDNVVYNGNDWDVMGGVIDLSDYATKVEMQQAVGDITTATDAEVRGIF